MIFKFAIVSNDLFALCVDALSSVIIHSEIDLIFTKSIAYIKMHKNSQNFFEFPVSSVIKQRNSPLDKIAEIIDHLPNATVQIMKLVTPLGSQLYCRFKSLLKYSFINAINKFVAHNLIKYFWWKYWLKIFCSLTSSFKSCSSSLFIWIFQRLL